VHKEATDRRSVRLPSTAVALASRPSPRQRPAGQPQPATRRGPLCDEYSHQSRRQPGRARRSRQWAQATPPIALTLRAMNLGKRHLGAPRLGRCAALLVSVIALALVLSAVPAQAEECTSSSCVQYNPELPSAEGGHTSKPHQQNPAKASRSGNGGGTAPSNPSGGGGSNEAEEAGESESSPEKGGVAPGHNGGSGQGKGGGSANPGAKEASHSPTQTASGKPVSHSDDGGSSPLVPILIAIAVLAAISVAVVMIRQRRQRNSGGPAAAASPEAN